MAKPSVLYSWGLTTSVPPTSGHQTNGYAVDEVPAANEWNTKENNWAQWLQMVKNWEVVPPATVYDFTTTTSVNNWDPTGGTGTLAGVYLVEIIATGGSSDITITGMINPPDDYRLIRLYNNTTKNVILPQLSGSSSSSCQFSFPRTITLAPGGWVELYHDNVVGSSTVHHWHLASNPTNEYRLVTRTISANTAMTFSDTYTVGAGKAGPLSDVSEGAWSATAQFQAVAIGLPMAAGETLVNVRAFVTCGTTDQLNLGIWRHTNTPGASRGNTQLTGTDVTPSSGHSNLIEVLSVSGLTEVVGANMNYSAVLDAIQYATNPTVIGIEIDVLVS